MHPAPSGDANSRRWGTAGFSAETDVDLVHIHVVNEIVQAIVVSKSFGGVQVVHV